MRDSSEHPPAWRIHSGDQDLAVRKFEEVGSRPRMNRGRHAFRAEDDGPGGLLKSPGHRKIVTHCAFPGIENVRVIEGFSADCRASAPAKIISGMTKHCCNGRIPCRSQ